MQKQQRLIIAITGATGVIYGIRLLQVLQDMPDIQTHLVISKAGLLSLAHEQNMTRQQLQKLADVTHSEDDIAASIASGSFATLGMIVAPCSMKTLAAIAHGFGDNLISRAADVCLKERRRLVLMPRETPLNLSHIRNMAAVTEMGGVIFPPLPSFYSKNSDMQQLVDESVGRALALLDIETCGLFTPWQGLKK